MLKHPGYSLLAFLLVLLMSCKEATPVAIVPEPPTGPLPITYRLASLRNSDNVWDDAIYRLAGLRGLETVVVNNKLYLYASGFTDDGITFFEVRNNGTLRYLNYVQDISNFELDGVQGLATTTIGEHEYLYASGGVDDGVSAFRILSNGAPSHTHPFTETVSNAASYNLNGADSLAITQVGGRQFLIVAGYNDDGLSLFEISTNGQLLHRTNVNNSLSTNLNGPRDLEIAVVGTKTFLFVSADVDKGVSVYEVGVGGTLTNRDNINDTGGFNHKLDGAWGLDSIQIGDKTFLFVAGLNDDGVTVFEVGSNGDLTYRSSVVDADDAANLELDGALAIHAATFAGQTYLVVGSTIDDGISIFGVSPDGNLTNLLNLDDTDNTGYQFDGVRTITSAILDNKAYLFVGGESDNGISVFEAVLGDS
ncbi:MAG: lactonase family protein [Spirochaetales bacterium]|nr:lactonase family protein [Spirochaetales bacterium]